MATLKPQVLQTGLTLTALEELSILHRFSIDVVRLLEKIYGNDLEKVLRTLRTPGSNYYFRVNTLKTDPHQIVDRFRAKGFQVRMHSKIQEALYIPIEGPLEIPLFEKKVVADKFAAESVLQGAHLYAPGIVRCGGIRRGDRVTIVDEFTQLVGAGIARMSETEILTYRKGLAIEVTHPAYKIPSLRETEEFREGLIYPQSFPAILTGRILDPQPNEYIVDLTCSPGGKLSHICQLTENAGKIVGVDRNEQKISTARENLTRLGCRDVTLIPHDARYFHIDFPETRADRCILDPPCSALGVMPKLYEYASDAEIQALAKYQKQILGAASRVVKPRGTVVYSVCTLTLDECEEVVRFGIEKCGLELEEQKFFFGSEGLTSSLPEAKLTQRFHPHIHGSGYFIASFNRI